MLQVKDGDVFMGSFNIIALDEDFEILALLRYTKYSVVKEVFRMWNVQCSDTT